VLRDAEIAAVYTGQRVAGDCYEFLSVRPSRMLFVLRPRQRPEVLETPLNEAVSPLQGVQCDRRAVI